VTFGVVTPQTPPPRKRISSKGEQIAKKMLRSSDVGYSRRREDREIAESIAESNRRISGVTLGQVCAAQLIVLDVSCNVCPRKGPLSCHSLN